MLTKFLAVSTVSALALVSTASAQDTYFSVSGGGSFLMNSSNQGTFVGDFTTGLKEQPYPPARSFPTAQRLAGTPTLTLAGLSTARLGATLVLSAAS